MVMNGCVNSQLCSRVKSMPPQGCLMLIEEYITDAIFRSKVSVFNSGQYVRMNSTEFLFSHGAGDWSGSGLRFPLLAFFTSQICWISGWLSSR